MPDDQDALDEILRELHSALRKAVTNAPRAHSEYAAALLDFTTQYAMTLREQAPDQDDHLVWSPAPDDVRGLTQEVVNLVKGDQWQRALEQSHVVLSVLPGEPGGIPMKPPKLPW
jgi:hypothetical protein